MILINLAAVVVALAMVIIVATLVPLLLDLRKTASVLRDFISNLESELKPTLKELNGTLADLKIITNGAAVKVEDLQDFITAAGDAGRGLRRINSVVEGATELLTRSSIWLTGAKAAGAYLLEKYTKKRG